VLTASPFCLFVFVSVLFLLCWESLLFFSLDLVPIHFLPPHLHLNHHVLPPPTPLPPEAVVCLAILVDAATHYLSPSPFPSPSLFQLSPFQLIVVFPPTAIAVAAVVFVALPLPWLLPLPLLLPLHMPSPQLQSSLPPSMPLLPLLL
jgi:hypothetical protein